MADTDTLIGLVEEQNGKLDQLGCQLQNEHIVQNLQQYFIHVCYVFVNTASNTFNTITLKCLFEALL